MDEATAANVIRWYESLEERVVDYMKGTPPQGQNLRAWSPILATVLVEACNLLESVLYHITPEPPPSSLGLRSRSRLILEHYAKLYSKRFGLPGRKVAFFQEPFGWRIPFKRWARRKMVPKKGLVFPAPEWWNVHNASKHRRLDHFNEFTLEKTIDALAGALVIITTAPYEPSGEELALAMVKNGWTPTQTDILNFYKGRWGLYFFCPETRLFSVPLGEASLPKDIHALQNPRSQISILGGGQKLGQWLGLPDSS